MTHVKLEHSSQKDKRVNDLSDIKEYWKEKRPVFFPCSDVITEIPIPVTKDKRLEVAAQMRHAASYEVISLHLADAIFLIYFHNDSSKLTTTTSFTALRTRSVFTLGSARCETTVWCEAVLLWNAKHTVVVKVTGSALHATRQRVH